MFLLQRKNVSLLSFSSARASILRDVKSSTKKAPAAKSLVVLGDNESGRTTLIAKLQDSDDPKRGAGLEYHYIDIKDEDRDGKIKFDEHFLKF